MTRVSLGFCFLCSWKFRVRKGRVVAHHDMIDGVLQATWCLGGNVSPAAEIPSVAP